MKGININTVRSVDVKSKKFKEKYLHHIEHKIKPKNGMNYINIPAHELDEHLLELANLFHVTRQPEKAGVRAIEIPILLNDPAGGYKENTDRLKNRF